MDADILAPITMSTTGVVAIFVAITILGIFNGFTVFIFFKTIVVDTGFIEEHTTIFAFVDAEFGRDDTSFGTTTLFNLGATFDHLPHDGGFTRVTELTSSATDEAIEFVRITELFLGGSKVAAK